MGHQKFTDTGKKFLGQPILKPDRPFHAERNTRIPETQRQLEVLERAALIRRVEAKSQRIRNKTRLGSK